MTNTTNLSMLAQDLMKVYDELREGKITAEQARNLAKIANATVGTARVVLDFHIWQNPKNHPESVKTDIPILN